MKILNIKCEVGASPFLPVIVTQIELEGLDKKYLYLIEVDDGCNFFNLNEDYFDQFLNEEYDDKLEEIIQTQYMTEYDNIDLSGYDKIVKTIDKANSPESAKLIKLMIAITRSDVNTTKSIIKESINKDLKDIKDYDMCLEGYDD